MTRLHALWESIRTTYWALPSLMTLAAIGLSVAMIQLDEAVSTKLLGTLPWVYAGGPEGARAVLSTIAGSMIGVAGVTFSITIVALTLASQQFGPRLLRNFLRDLGNQIVLGTFVSTFIYCLLVLRTVRGQEDAAFVPHLAVTAGVVLAVVSLGVLIYFIHHISVSIQATQIIAQIGADLEAAIDRLFPEEVRQGIAEGGQTPGEVTTLSDHDSLAAVSLTSGYVQVVDTNGLAALACERDLVLHVEVRPGTFVRKGSRLASVGAGARLDDELARAICNAFIIGNDRTPTQDIDFFISQLVELAGRALSPGVNDPGTARTCLDRLGQALCRLAGRRFASGLCRDVNGALRVVTPAVTFPSVADGALNEIRRYGRSNVSVTTHLFAVVRDVASCVRREADRLALMRHAHLIGRGSLGALTDDADRAQVEAQYRATLAVLQAAAGDGGAGPRSNDLDDRPHA